MYNTAFKSTVELQSYIRLDQSNIRLSRIELKYVAFNWFRRRILHALNSAIRFGARKMRRLNRALDAQLIKVTADLQRPILSKMIYFYTKFKTSTLFEFSKKVFSNLRRERVIHMNEKNFKTSQWAANCYKIANQNVST